MNTDPAELAKVLKPCPFCGFQVDEHSFGKPGERWEVFCRACDSAGRPSDTMEQAIAAWNRRPANTMTAEEVRVPLDLFKRPTHPAASIATRNPTHEHRPFRTGEEARRPS